MSLTIDEYMKCKKKYQEEIADYLVKMKTNFETETGLKVQDIFVDMIETRTLGENEGNFIVSGVSIQTNLSD